MSPADQFLVPEYINGIPSFVPYAGDIQRMVKEGAPTFNWEGDPRLYIAPRDPQDGGGFIVGRLNEDNTKSLICTSEAPHVLDEGLLIWLAEHDTRHVDVYARVEKNNAEVKKKIDDHTKERVGEAMERVIHGLKADVGHHY